MSENTRKLWFIRRNQEIRGPFPTAAVAQFLLIGRITKHDEVSLDKQAWQKIDEVPDLVPHVLKADLTNPVNQSNLAAARMGADERAGGDRRNDNNTGHLEQRVAERRMAEFDKKHAKRQAEMKLRLEEAEQKTKKQNRLTTFSLLLLFAGLIVFIFMYNPQQEAPDIDCNAPPAMGINWSNCNLQGAELNGAVLGGARIRNANLTGASLFRADLQGADISYTNLGLVNLRMTNLVGANLVGTIFRNSDLRGANLSGADLSYADFQGAQLVGVSLSGAKLNKTIWVDGQICSPGSVGECIPVQ